MKIFDDIATGKTYGYESHIVPTWEEMRHLYDTKARVVGKAAREAKKNRSEQERECQNREQLQEEITVR